MNAQQYLLNQLHATAVVDFDACLQANAENDYDNPEV